MPAGSILAMPTSVVTGGAGFLGSHLCEALLQRGHRVFCVDNLVTSSLQNIEHIRTPEFAFVNHDVVQPIEIEEPVDFVYHFAALASPQDYLRMPLHSLKVGSYGTHNALGLAKWKRARFLIASTSEVYGDPEVHPQPESYWGNVNPIGPRGVYDEAKRYAEALTMAYHSQQGVDTAIVRIFNSILADEQVLYDDGRELRREPVAALAQRPPGCLHGSRRRSRAARRSRVRGRRLLGARLRRRRSHGRGARSCAARSSAERSLLRGDDPVRPLDQGHRRPLDLRRRSRRRAGASRGGAAGDRRSSRDRGADLRPRARPPRGEHARCLAPRGGRPVEALRRG
jgi:hypothetical protein